MKKVLITGGAGYIGAHMIRVLSERGYKPVVFDNFSTGYRDYVPAGVTLIKGDLRNPGDIQKVFKKYKICAVMHFAAAIVVSESVSNPLKYYEDNVVGFVNLLKAMVQAGVDKIIFSSSACVYGNPLKNPITEDEP